jgi:TonB family protein
MMSAYANGLQKPESIASYVRRFRVICVTHGIPIGSPANLPVFLQKLINDRPLAMDFWGFVSKLSDREGGELTDDQLLAVVVEGVAKDDIPPDDPNLKRTVDDLRAMLAGVDVHDPGQLEPAPFPKDEAPLQQREQTWRSPAEQPHPDNAAPATIPPHLDKALHRLELTNLELKQHLEAIDKRMSRLEPHLAGSSDIGTDRNERISRAANAVQQQEELTHKPVGQSRLVLEPAHAPADMSFTRKRGTLHIPLESYYEQSGYGRAALALLVVLILAAATFAGYRYRVPLREQLTALTQNIQARVENIEARNTSTTAQPSQNATPAEDTSTGQAQQGNTSATQPSPEKAVTPPARAGSHAPTEQATFTGSLPPATAHDSAGTRRLMADRIAAQTQPDGISSSDLAGAVRVAPAVMEAKLVASRVPAYPDSAKIQGVEGSVVMQAIISRDGTVKHVHVIEGDSRLRNAATDAVYKWRYRPYLLNGEPVDVATTITVDFDLDR